VDVENSWCFTVDSMSDAILFLGRAPEQVDEFLVDEIDPILEEYKDLLAVEAVDGVMFMYLKSKPDSFLDVYVGF